MLKINKNVLERVLRTGFALVLSSSLIAPVTGCSSEKESPITFEELFYDDNNEGLDDYFEKNVDNSEDYISRIIDFEKKINFVREFNSFLKNPNLDNDLKNNLEKMNVPTDIEIDNINDTIQNFNLVRDFFTSDSCKAISDEKNNMYNTFIDLYKQFLLINKDIKTKKISTNIETKELEINYFGLKLINSVPAQLKGLDPDDFKTRPKKANYYSILYHGTTTDDITINSNIVSETLDDICYYQKNAEDDPDGQYDENLIDMYLNTLEKYKIILLANHKTAMESHFFSDREELQLDDQNIDEIKTFVKGENRENKK